MTTPANQPTPDREYEFIVLLSNSAELTAPVEDALFEAGCDDATLSVRSGRLWLTFARTAASLEEAIASALRDVRTAGLNVVAIVTEGPDDGRLTEDLSRLIESR